MKSCMAGSQLPSVSPCEGVEPTGDQGEAPVTPVKRAVRNKENIPSSHEKRMEPLLAKQDQILQVMAAEGARDREALACLFANPERDALKKRQLEAQEKELEIKRQRLELDARKFEADQEDRRNRDKLMMMMMEKLSK